MKKRAGLFFAAIAGIVTTATLASAQISHAYNISLGSPDLKGGVQASTTAQQMGLAYSSDSLIAQRGPTRGVGAPLPTGSTTTDLLFKNASQPPVDVYITLPAASQLGGPTLISQIRINNGQIPITALNAQQGFFTLNTGVNDAKLTATTGATLDGLSIAFGALPQCPCTAPTCAGGESVNLPNGVNIFSATLNPPNNLVRRDESINISAVTGANSLLLANLRPGQGNNWSDLNGHNDVEEFSNGYVDVTNRVDQNCGRIGVFKYNTPVCASSAALGPCGNGQPICPTVGAPNNCRVQRSSRVAGTTFFGGQVKVVYNGPAAPPAP
ncbi:MAG: hypothetical protein K2Z81_02485 [Cyanobacteria bacterium]|nr:hypothetical protein [Cyanobacteriota bacterium]